MKIYSMTATFGKLENRTLTLEPGLNIISAPNEWGKSTWCAFLATMLYGLDTREKTTKTTLAVKERYAPWSGAPMSGRIDLNWNGQNITIERWSKGRTPLGEFKAYETESGLPVAELTGANCGEKLLGVEKSVFLRAGFLRLADLPVTADESLRRRLNALVTTGDESGAADDLGQKLKDLKNKCRFNRTGLIPLAEAEKKELEDKIAELQRMQTQCETTRNQQRELMDEIAMLENHEQALQYAAETEKQNRIRQAQLRRDAAREHWEQLATQSKDLPSPEESQRTTHLLQQLHQESIALSFEQQMLPMPPEPPQSADINSPYDALKQAEKHRTWLQDLYKDQKAAKKLQHRSFIAIATTIPAALIAWLLSHNAMITCIAGAIPLLVGIVLFFIARGILQEIPGHLRWLEAMYGSLDADAWVHQIQDKITARERYARVQSQYAETISAFRTKQESLTARVEAMTQGTPIADCLQYWESVAQAWGALEEARRIYDDAKAHAESLQVMAKPVQTPSFPDTLTYSPIETRQMLEEKRRHLQFLQQRLGQCQGRMDALGSETALQNALAAVNARLDKLTLYHNALELALLTLKNATDQLQRRFAPRIAEAARALFSKLTDGRYDRLNLTQELSVNTAATEDVAIRSAIWRSEGTVDQLYFALRLAVARELTPHAPLILDDVLVRFDDTRHARAMEILRQEAEDKQIILFTCQSRETDA